MKKYIVLIFLVTISSKFYAQININLLEENIFATEILFNEKCIEDIDGTNGDELKMKGLFGNTLTRSSQITKTGTQVVYLGNGIKFIFKENNNTSSILYLSSIEISNSFPVVKLQSKLISVNNSINTLENIQKSKYRDENYILYRVNAPVDMVLLIYYNISTNKITSISYSNQLDY